MSLRQPLSLSLFLLGCRPWEEREQMLGEGGGGNAGVHADHHSLNLSSVPHSPNLHHHNIMAELPAHYSTPPPPPTDQTTQPPRPTLSLSVYPSLYCMRFLDSLHTPPAIPHISISKLQHSFYSFIKSLTFGLIWGNQPRLRWK